MLTLNEHGKLARFYLRVGPDNDLPKDLCTLFWGLVFRLVVILLLLGIAFICLAGIFTFIRWAYFFIQFHKRQSAIVIAALLGGAFVVWLRARKFETVSEIVDVIAAKYVSVKSRYCPRIEWK